MAPPKSMSPRESDESIKDRKTQIFAAQAETPEQVSGPKPFAAYVREARAAPLPLETKATFGGLGALILILMVLGVVSAPRKEPGDSAPGGTAPAAPAKLTGKVIGSEGSWHNQGATREKAFDGDPNSHVDIEGVGIWVGLDLGSPKVITKVRYAPRPSLASRMVGGKIQGSSTPDFSQGVEDLFTITAPPPAGGLTDQAITGGKAFRYVRYLSPANGYGNIGELEFWGRE